VFLDITATHEKRDTIVELARRTADDVFVPFTIGGGIRSVADAQAVLDAGADKVSVNSAAVARPELIDELAAQFGAQCVVLAIDAKAREDGGWGGPCRRRAHSRPARRRRVGARGRRARGAGEILLTSMDRDGTSDGYDLALTAAVSGAVGVPVIASGGAGTLEHLVEALAAGADAVAVRVDLPLRPVHGSPQAKDAATGSLAAGIAGAWPRPLSLAIRRSCRSPQRG
jgi:cyclase